MAGWTKFSLLCAFTTTWRNFPRSNISFYYAFNSEFKFFYFYFFGPHDIGVGGGEPLSLSEFSMFVDERLTLSTDHTKTHALLSSSVNIVP